jgi:predicted nucleotidyltransferase component of viral defense system
MYTNPKLTEYQMDEIFVQNLIRNRKSTERKDIIDAVTAVLFAGAVLVLCFVAAAQLGA